MTTIEPDRVRRSAVATASPGRAGRREWAALAVLCLPLLIVSMDVSVLFFAAPFIAKALHPSALQQLWIFDIYGFVLAGLLLTMGALGDRIGRRRVLLVGAVGFAAASVLAAAAPSAGVLILARALLGVGGATLMPSSIALVREMFPDPGQRLKAMSVWSAVLAGGVTVGPIVSGVLLDHFSWRSVFLINLPAMAALLVVAPLMLPAGTGNPRARVDWTSSVLALAAILATTYGLKTLAADGWADRPGFVLVVGVLVAAVFVDRQLRLEHPLLDVRALLRRRTGGAILVNFVGSFGLMASSIAVTQFLQSVLGLDPLIAALWSALPAVAVGGAAALAAALSATFGRARVMAGGLVFAAAGFGVLTRVQVSGALALTEALIGAGLVAAGIVSVITLVADYVMGVNPVERAGAIGGLIETSSELGGAFGIAILGAVLAAKYHAAAARLLPASLTGAARGTAEQTVAAATVTAHTMPQTTRAGVLHASHVAFIDAMHTTGMIACVLLLVTAALTLTLLREGSVDV
jgi:MFS transporter, DHA2 family, multidrug resistance protein